MSADTAIQATLPITYSRNLLYGNGMHYFGANVTYGVDSSWVEPGFSQIPPCITQIRECWTDKNPDNGWWINLDRSKIVLYSRRSSGIVDYVAQYFVICY